MTRSALAVPAGRRGRLRPEAAQLCLLIAALASITLFRAAINGTTTVSAFVAGTLSGVGLLGVAAVASTHIHIRLPSLREFAIGLAGGAVMVAIPYFTRTIAGGTVAGSFHPEPFAGWVAVTCLVATAEEAMLRGVLFDRAHAAAGLLPAVLLTSAVFALMHVPLYGWSVVPVDFAAGLVLCGLRLLTGGIGASAIAHSVADLATWWL